MPFILSRRQPATNRGHPATVRFRGGPPQEADNGGGVDDSTRSSTDSHVGKKCRRGSAQGRRCILLYRFIHHARNVELWPGCNAWGFLIVRMPHTTRKPPIYRRIAAASYSRGPARSATTPKNFASRGPPGGPFHQRLERAPAYFASGQVVMSIKFGKRRKGQGRYRRPVQGQTADGHRHPDRRCQGR